MFCSYKMLTSNDSKSAGYGCHVVVQESVGFLMIKGSSIFSSDSKPVDPGRRVCFKRTYRHPFSHLFQNATGINILLFTLLGLFFFNCSYNLSTSAHSFNAIQIPPFYLQPIDSNCTEWDYLCTKRSLREIQGELPKREGFILIFFAPSTPMQALFPIFSLHTDVQNSLNTLQGDLLDYFSTHPPQPPLPLDLQRKVHWIYICLQDPHTESAHVSGSNAPYSVTQDDTYATRQHLMKMRKDYGLHAAEFLMDSKPSYFQTLFPEIPINKVYQSPVVGIINADLQLVRTIECDSIEIKTDPFMGYLKDMASPPDFVKSKSEDTTKRFPPDYIEWVVTGFQKSQVNPIKGGFGRVSTFLKEYRAHHTESMVFQMGNFTSELDDLRTENQTFNRIQILGFNGLIFGPNEWNSFLSDRIDKEIMPNIPLYPLIPHRNLPGHIPTFCINKKNIAVVSIIDPSLLKENLYDGSDFLSEDSGENSFQQWKESFKSKEIHSLVTHINHSSDLLFVVIHLKNTLVPWMMESLTYGLKDYSEPKVFLYVVYTLSKEDVGFDEGTQAVVQDTVYHFYFPASQKRHDQPDVLLFRAFLPSNHSKQKVQMDSYHLFKDYEVDPLMLTVSHPPQDDQIP